MLASKLRKYVPTHIACHHVAVWHDHSTVCGCEVIMVACKEVYNRLVHYTEYKALTGQSVDVQAPVEHPTYISLQEAHHLHPTTQDSLWTGWYVYRY